MGTCKRNITESVHSISSLLLAILLALSLHVCFVPTVNADVTRPATPTLQQKMSQEKITFESRGSVLQASVLGQPGRYCALFMKTSTNPNWVMVRGTKTIIGDSGRAVIKTDLKTIAKGRILIRLTSSSQGDFQQKLLSTPSFEFDTAAAPTQVKTWSAIGEGVTKPPPPLPPAPIGRGEIISK